MSSSLKLAPEITTDEIIVDTIPLSYFLMGIYHGKTKQKIKPIANIPFKENKAKLLAMILRNKTMIITPQVLAEMSNHAKNNIKEISSFLRITKDEILGFKEEFVRKEALLSDPPLFRFGITDMSLLKIGNDERTLITGEQKRKLDSEYGKLHNVQVINIQDVFQRFENLGIE